MSALLVLIASAIVAAAAGAITLNVAALVGATAAASALGLLSGALAVVALITGYLVGSTVTDRAATQMWGPPLRRA